MPVAMATGIGILLNIEAAGHAVLSCGGPTLAGPMKQGSTFSGNATAITESVQLAFS